MMMMDRATPGQIYVCKIGGTGVTHTVRSGNRDPRIERAGHERRCTSLHEIVFSQEGPSLLNVEVQQRKKTNSISEDVRPPGKEDLRFPRDA